MPQPKEGTLVARPDLGIAVMEYHLKGPSLGYIGPQIMPILEVGKQWDQAWGDIAEAIDFFEYYGRESKIKGMLLRLLI